MNENELSQQNQENEVVQTTQLPEKEKKGGSSIALFVFALVVLLAIWLVWNNTQTNTRQEQLPTVPEEQILQTTEDIESEITTIESEITEIESETVLQAL